MALGLIEIDGPAHWASALVNGDFSAIGTEEAMQIQSWRENELPPDASFVGVREDSERFTWCYRLHGGDANGGTVCTYQVLADIE